jgi:hypothetical protein
MKRVVAYVLPSSLIEHEERITLRHVHVLFETCFFKGNNTLFESNGGISK